MVRGRKEDAILEKKMELGNVSEKSIEDEYGSKRTRTLFCPTNCEYFFLPENEGFEGYGGMQGGMSFEDMVVETKEKPRRVKKRKEEGSSANKLQTKESHQREESILPMPNGKDGYYVSFSLILNLFSVLPLDNICITPLKMQRRSSRPRNASNLSR
ncbi:hypothetical protein Gotri_001823 [Gossypium trilobum]|uniref:Uncharacterized protein n=1 Tax=Gossypium trilobum TaxID=34281 RepID=A0A7J9FGD0_9ROSI|nr:hypothetical protein [Gossypium trilobum]